MHSLHVTSPEATNQIAGVRQAAVELERQLEGEMTDHARAWQRRKDCYRSIKWNTKQLSENIQRVLHQLDLHQMGTATEILSGN